MNTPAWDRSADPKHTKTPRLAVLLLLVGTLTLAIGGGLTLVTLKKQLLERQAEQLQAHELSGQITHLDEVLTMSARMAVATGDGQWLLRYRDHEARLRQVLHAFIELSPDSLTSKAGKQAATANKRLVELEERAFALLAADDREAALRKLNSTQYEQQKFIFGRGMTRASAAIQADAATVLTLVRRDTNRMVWIALIGMLLIGLGWMHFYVRLRSHVHRAVDAASSKATFLANMSHEIRTPMTAILGFADTLEDRSLPEDERDEAIATIQRNGTHLLNVINDILDFSKLESDQMTTDPIATNPHELAADIVRLLTPRATEKGLELHMAVGANVPDLVRIDPTRTRQVLINLIGNSIKFTESGSVRLTLDHVDKAKAIAFGVTDTGIGMTEKAAAQVFQSFTQADGSVARRFGGTGLGLTISGRIARLMDGSLRVASTQVGVGTSFVMHLPYEAPSEAEITVAKLRKNRGSRHLGGARRAAPNEAAQSSLKGRRALIVDDGADNRRLLSFILKRWGAEVELAEHGGEAVERVRESQRPYDAILMDIQMPVLDGYRATKAIRLEGYSGPILALTAHAFPEERARCVDAGCSDVLAKPIDREALLTALQRHTAARDNTDEDHSTPS